MKFKVETVKAKELQPGDLFTSYDEEYWEGVPRPGVVGEKVFIRTTEPCPEDQTDIKVCRIEVSA